jgi:hypothetical protein
MVVNRLALGSDFPTIRYGASGEPHRRRSVTGTTPADRGDPENERGVRDRYRVDAAYRAYRRSTAESSLPAGGPVNLRKISSAELLNSMIDRMGGALTSSAKGAFVDIIV